MKIYSTVIDFYDNAKINERMAKKKSFIKKLNAKNVNTLITNILRSILR